MAQDDGKRRTGTPPLPTGFTPLNQNASDIDEQPTVQVNDPLALMRQLEARRADEAPTMSTNVPLDSLLEAMQGPPTLNEADEEPTVQSNIDDLPTLQLNSADLPTNAWGLDTRDDPSNPKMISSFGEVRLPSPEDADSDIGQHLSLEAPAQLRPQRYPLGDPDTDSTVGRYLQPLAWDSDNPQPTPRPAPKKGKHRRAKHDEDTVLLYQAQSSSGSFGLAAVWTGVMLLVAAALLVIIAILIGLLVAKQQRAPAQAPGLESVIEAPAAD